APNERQSGPVFGFVKLKAKITNAGHLWSTLFGLHGDPHWSVLHMLSIAAIFRGFILLSAAWKVLYDAQSRHALATTGVYEHVRHPSILASLSSCWAFCCSGRRC